MPHLLRADPRGIQSEPPVKSRVAIAGAGYLAARSFGRDPFRRFASGAFAQEHVTGGVGWVVKFTGLFAGSLRLTAPGVDALHPRHLLRAPEPRYSVTSSFSHGTSFALAPGARPTSWRRRRLAAAAVFTLLQAAPSAVASDPVKGMSVSDQNARESADRHV